MNTLRTPAKVGIVLFGLVAAFAAAYIAVLIRQRLTSGPDAQASAGMYAFGDLLLGIAVFGVLALGPLALALFWLRPVAWFWSAFTGGAAAWALTSLAAIACSGWFGQFPPTVQFVADARIFAMPLSALAFATCSFVAPQVRQRWVLLAAAFADGAIFATIVIVKFILPNYRA